MTTEIDGIVKSERTVGARRSNDDPCINVDVRKFGECQDSLQSNGDRHAREASRTTTIHRIRSMSTPPLTLRIYGEGCTIPKILGRRIASSYAELQRQSSPSIWCVAFPPASCCRLSEPGDRSAQAHAPADARGSESRLPAVVDRGTVDLKAATAGTPYA